MWRTWQPKTVSFKIGSGNKELGIPPERNKKCYQIPNAMC